MLINDLLIKKSRVTRFKLFSKKLTLKWRKVWKKLIVRFQLTITKFDMSLDWFRFWNQFEREIVKA